MEKKIFLGFPQFTQFTNTISCTRHFYPKCRPIALDVGTIAPEMMLLPYKSEPDTGSRIPSLKYIYKNNLTPL